MARGVRARARAPRPFHVESTFALPGRLTARQGLMGALA